MLHLLYATSPLLNFGPINFPTYCKVGATRLGQARGPGAAATSPHSTCKTMC